MRRPPGRRRVTRKPWESTDVNSAGGSRAWGKLKNQVVAEEPFCRLRLPCCTILSETADHIHPKSARRDLAMVRANLRGACKACNSARGNRPLEKVRAEMIASGRYKQRPDPSRGVQGVQRPAAALKIFERKTG